MTFMNLLIGLPAMLLCLVLQTAVAFWCVRYYVRHASQVEVGHGFVAAIRPLIVTTLAMVVGTLAQVMLWGGLFLWLGEFEQAYDAIYHSAVNFSSLGYGDIVMRRERRLLGPLEAVKRRADAGHERGDADGDPAAHDQAAARRTRAGLRRAASLNTGRLAGRALEASPRRTRMGKAGSRP
jgi:hypothetical protein